jgi:nicotinate-nucleotide pyrophosphorylase (carboxylating)
MDLIPLIDRALLEDVGEGDHTSLSTIPAGSTSQVELVIKQSGVLAGVELAGIILNHVDDSLQLRTLLEDGAAVEPGDKVLTIFGDSRNILKAERLMLNCMQRMSGVATVTKEYVDRIANTQAKVVDTRKTLPGLRQLDKWAVRIGGGMNHRMGLYDMIMIKDNHVDFAGGIEQAITAAVAYRAEKKLDIQIEIETRNLDEVDQVLAVGGVDRIMLDNFMPSDIRTALDRIGGRVETEASGGITLETIKEYAETGVDYISVGALTHSVKGLDMSLLAV